MNQKKRHQIAIFEFSYVFLLGVFSYETFTRAIKFILNNFDLARPTEFFIIFGLAWFIGLSFLGAIFLGYLRSKPWYGYQRGDIFK